MGHTTRPKWCTGCQAWQPYTYATDPDRARLCAVCFEPIECDACGDPWTGDHECPADPEPAAVTAYLGPLAGRDRAVVAEVFIPGTGWLHPSPTAYGTFPTITIRVARRLRREGVTVVSLRSGTHSPDFTLAELLRN